MRLRVKRLGNLNSENLSNVAEKQVNAFLNLGQGLEVDKEAILGHTREGPSASKGSVASFETWAPVRQLLYSATMGSKGKKQLAHGRNSVTKGFSRGLGLPTSFLIGLASWQARTLKMLNRHPDEELLVAMRGQAILGGATISLVCNGRGLWCSQIGSLHRSGGGTALVDAMFQLVF